MPLTRRKADPWRDTDVIDEQAPRFNQAVVGLVALAGVVFGWPLAWALMGAQLRRLLSDPVKLRIFNICAALTLVATLYPIVFGGH